MIRPLEVSLIMHYPVSNLFKRSVAINLIIRFRYKGDSGIFVTGAASL
jgi:hypothetical protein